MKSKKLLTLGLLLFGAANSLAGGARDGGGGSYVVIDGRVMVADPYYAGAPVSDVKKITRISYFDFPKEIRDYVDQTERVCALLRICTPSELKWADSFFGKVVRVSDKHYFLVPKDRESNVPCERYLPLLNRPVDDHFQYGCTFGPDTYLFVEQWQKAPIEEQAFALLHERLWAFKEDADQADIAGFIQGLRVFERRYVAQALQGDRSLLSPADVETYLRLFSSATRMGLNWADPSGLTVISAGAVTPLECAQKITLENSFLAIGSSVNCGVSSATLKIRNSTLLGTELSFADAEWKMKRDEYEIADSEITDSVIDVSSIKNSRVSSSRLVSVDVSKSSISHSRIDQSFYDLDCRKEVGIPQVLQATRISFANISDSEVYGKCSNVEMLGSESARIRLDQVKVPDLFRTALSIGEGASLSRVKISGMNQALGFQLGRNTRLQNLEIEFEDGVQRPGSERYALFEAKFVSGTEIKNGKMKSISRCGGSYWSDVPTNHYFLGQSTGGVSKDLHGGQWDLGTLWPFCEEKAL